jgi:hypothetical protein
MVVFLAGGDQGVPWVVNTVFERGGDNPISVGFFNGNDNEVLPLALLIPALIWIFSSAASPER